MDLAQLGANIAWQLEQMTGLQVAITLQGHTATLRGRVPSVEARQAVLDLTAELAPRWRIVDELDVEDLVPRRVHIREPDHPDDRPRAHIHGAFRHVPADFRAVVGRVLQGGDPDDKHPGRTNRR